MPTWSYHGSSGYFELPRIARPTVKIRIGPPRERRPPIVPDDLPRPPDGERVATVFIPGAGRLPAPHTLAEYAAIDPSYPKHGAGSHRSQRSRAGHADADQGGEP